MTDPKKVAEDQVPEMLKNAVLVHSAPLPTTTPTGMIGTLELIIMIYLELTNILDSKQRILVWLSKRLRR